MKKGIQGKKYLDSMTCDSKVITLYKLNVIVVITAPPSG